MIGSANSGLCNGACSTSSVQFEPDSSNAAMTHCSAGDDPCRGGICVLKNVTTGHGVEMSFCKDGKDGKAVGRLNFGAGGAPSLAAANGTQAGVAVDTANRCIGFTSAVRTTGSSTVKRNGSLACITHFDARG